MSETEKDYDKIASDAHHTNNPGLYGPMGTLSWEGQNRLVPEVSLSRFYELVYRATDQIRKKTITRYDFKPATLKAVFDRCTRQYEEIKQSVEGLELSKHEQGLYKTRVAEYLQEVENFFSKLARQEEAYLKEREKKNLFFQPPDTSLFDLLESYALEFKTLRVRL